VSTNLTDGSVILKVAGKQPMWGPNYEYSSPIKCDFENTYETSNKISIKQKVKGTNVKNTPAGTFRYTLQSESAGGGSAHAMRVMRIFLKRRPAPVEMRARSADEYEGIYSVTGRTCPMMCASTY
jgi:hypothetical protein